MNIQLKTLSFMFLSVFSFDVISGPCFSTAKDPQINIPEEDYYSSSLDKTINEKGIDKGDISKIRSELEERETQVGYSNSLTSMDPDPSGIGCRYNGPCSFFSESAFLNFQYGKNVDSVEIMEQFNAKTGFRTGNRGRYLSEIIMSVRSRGINWKPKLSFDEELPESEWQRLDKLYADYRPPLNNRNIEWNKFLTLPNGIRESLERSSLTELEAADRLEQSELYSTSFVDTKLSDESGNISAHVAAVTKIGESPDRFVLNNNLFAATNKSGEDILSSSEVVDFMKDFTHSSDLNAGDTITAKFKIVGN